ncbi:hypothetical protein NUU61_009240 [Penicillium alfredii]|uniref:LicD/FKTN/FKRP nucleotidyltransferase domain-containing protein n=1 Tax=Penicillium alfredii TaxID=1506179 RepID=A0A9W9JX69_9EURO|nr:uncharacterized protein NUU61_009240 [Penicillium alfredii]KAJ5084661.1 hypothetical protein NUU61_009240 [Penicillium alfredii]
MSLMGSRVNDYESHEDIPTQKYFHESTYVKLFDLLGVYRPDEISCRFSSFHHHYDDRFANDTLPYEQVIPHLKALMQTYLSTMSAIGVETWIMHGTLLAWWWNEKIFPWDNDLDVQISEPAIHILAKSFNMTQHHFDLPSVEGGRNYMLDVNPYYVVQSTEDKLNMIDARWIDMSSGLFIDITAVRKDEERRRKGNPEALRCKDRHRYHASEIFPLRDSYFEDVPVKVPYAYTELLKREYGSKALAQTEFSDHRFNEHTKIWEAMG